MTEYVFAPTTSNMQTSWSDPTVWSGGVVPNGPAADVVISTTYSPDVSSAFHYVNIAQGETYAINSLALAHNFVEVFGSLSVAGALAFEGVPAGVDLFGGALSFGSLQNADEAVQGSGTVVSTGTIVNTGAILGFGLTVTAPALNNVGSLIAGAGLLTIKAALTNLADGTLSGGSFEAQGGGTLQLAGGGAITTDATTITLNNNTGDVPRTADLIESIDPVSGTLLPLEDTLRTIAASGTLMVIGEPYASGNALDVAGVLFLAEAQFSSSSLHVLAGGMVFGQGAISGPVADDGAITASNGALTINGDVSGAGALTVGPDSVPEPDSISQTLGTSTLELGGADTAPVTFASGAGTLVLDDPAGFTGTIAPAAPQALPGTPSSLYAYDAIILKGIAFGSVTGRSYAGDASGGVLTIDEGAASQTLRFSGDYTAADFVLSAGPQASPASPPSLTVQVAPLPAPPTVGFIDETGYSTATGVASGAEIVDATTPIFVAGDAPSVAGVSLQVDGAADGSVYNFVYGQSRSEYSARLNPVASPGLHRVSASVGNITGAASAVSPASLRVLPAAVGGVITADVSSAQIGALLDQGATMQFASAPDTVRLTDGTLSLGPNTDQALLQRLYEGLLGRAGDAKGLSSLDAALTQQGAAAAATRVIDSPEFQALHGPASSLSDPQFVTLMYQGLLGRAPDQGGLDAYTGALSGGLSRGAVAASIAQSAEAKAHLAADTANVWVPDQQGALVTQLFETAFNRAPDLQGLATDLKALAGGLTSLQLAQDIAGSTEFQAAHAGQSPAALVTSFYADGLGRAPDQAGLTRFVGALQSGSGAGAVLLDIATSPEAYGHLLRTV